MDVRNFRIEAVEDPDAPEHRRWRAAVRLVDGRSGVIHGGSPEELFEAFAEGAFADKLCDAPGCVEILSFWDECRGCGAVICPAHDSEPFREGHRPEEHWHPPILLGVEE